MEKEPPKQTFTAEQFRHAENYENFIELYSQQVYSSLVDATKACQQLPEDDYAYWSAFRPFKSSMQQVGRRLLSATQKFIQYSDADKKGSVQLEDLNDAEEVSEHFEDVVDILDSIVERVDMFADEAKGESNKPTIHISKAKLNTPNIHTSKATELNMFHGSNVLRPQLKFEDKIDNSNTPFQHKLKSKPNALIPLPDPQTATVASSPSESRYSREMEAHVRSMGLKISSNSPSPLADSLFVHPYEYEINNFSFLESQMKTVQERMYLPLETTPFEWINTPQQLSNLARNLDEQPEFAVDLEAHAYRSFQGFCCLMQISTRTHDYLIDVLDLRSHMQMLNTSFTNPKIVKVIHGSDSDVVWLQRDFGLYVVNLFDTGQAARVLEMPSFGLAHLLKHYCNINADKKYQLADWRIRPIPEEMKRYAREDTHYLLYIYDRMRNELIARGNASNNLILAVLNRSKALCLKKYEKELWTETAHIVLYNKQGLFFNQQQMRVYAALYAWRDRLARDEDESTRYVLPNHMMFQMSELIPSDVGGVLACCNPIPPLVKQYAADLAALIARARDALDVRSVIAEHYRLTGTTAAQALAADKHSGSDAALVAALSASSSALPPHSFNATAAPTPGAPSTVPASSGSGSASATSGGGSSLVPPQTPGTKLVVPGLQRALIGSPTDSSPVLPTDQLYKFAGWLPTARAKLAAVNVTPAGPRSASGGQLAPLLGDDDSSSSSEEESSKSKALAASIKATLAAALPTPAPAPAPSAPETAKPAHAPAPAVTATAPVAAAAPAPASQASLDDSEHIPQTMAEIYQLSNRNRKRNKEKKKLKEDAGPGAVMSPVVIDDDKDDEPADNDRRKKQKAHKDKDTMEFMREIGWVEGGAKPQSLQQSQSQQSSSKPAVAPFDYSHSDAAFKVAPAQAPPQQQQHEAWHASGSNKFHSRSLKTKAPVSITVPKQSHKR